MNGYKIFITGKYKIGATLLIPSKPSKPNYPAVLLIAGSGKFDRDVNAPQIKTNIFKELSDFFEQKGIISLRYDKRGCGKSEGKFNEAGITDFIDDAATALRHLKSHDLVDPKKILILGHSEGAFIAPAVYQQESANGLILLCGGVDSGNILLPLQLQMLAQEIQTTKSFKAFLLKLLRVDKFILWQFKRVLDRCLATTNPVIKIFGLFNYNAKWLREFYHFNIKDYLTGVRCPTLAIGCDKDIQINPNDAIRISEIIPSAESFVLKDVNHLLRTYSGRHTFLDCIKQYKQSVQEPLSTE